MAKRKPRVADYSQPITEQRTISVTTGWTHLCPSCLEPFTAKRSDATYCSLNCRHLAFRKRRRLLQ